MIFGVTGQQGGSIAHTVLQDAKLSQEYSIRGTTRDASSPRAPVLAREKVKLVQASLEDTLSLQIAFKGAHVVFPSTVTVYDDHAYEHEVTHGRALADAAVVVVCHTTFTRPCPTPVKF